MSGRRERTVYKTDHSGNVCRFPAESITTRFKTVETMEERVRQDLYGLECAHGSRFNGCGEYSKDMLKRVWVDNVERDNHIESAMNQALARAREAST